MKGAAWWPIAIVGVLGVNLLANGVLFWAARDRRGPAIETDYYRKALAWDSTRAIHDRSEALGWRIEAELGSPEGTGAPLRFRLFDRDGRPVSGAWVAIEAIHNAEPAPPVTIQIGDPDHPAAPDSAGDYVLATPLRRAGLWELRFDVRRGTARYVTSLRRETGALVRP